FTPIYTAIRRNEIKLHRVAQFCTEIFQLKVSAWVGKPISLNGNEAHRLADCYTCASSDCGRKLSHRFVLKNSWASHGAINKQQQHRADQRKNPAFGRCEIARAGSRSPSDQATDEATDYAAGNA